MIDLHSHILPRLDDGAPSPDEAVEMARMAEADGIYKMVATPHYFRRNRFNDDPAIVAQRRQEFQNTLRENNINLEILPGSEVHISHHLMDVIREHREALVLNGSSYMFVEFPREHVFQGSKQLFFDLMSEGITPIITHPERNSVFMKNPDVLFGFIQMGALAQANKGSFLGRYGRSVQAAVYSFLDLEYFQFVASDCHNTRSLDPRMSMVFEEIKELYGAEKAEALFQHNPEAVITDQEIPYLPDPVDPKKKKKSLKIKLPVFFK